jgi:hypothetical protein
MCGWRRQCRILLDNPDEWEDFIREWVTTLDGYIQIKCFGGSGGKGADIPAFNRRT